MKSIAIIANSTHGGGAENSMFVLHQKFCELNYQSIFIAINDMDDDIEVSDNALLLIGRKWNDGLKQTLSSLKKFNTELESVRPDVLIVNCELPELFIAFTNIKESELIVVEHTSNPWNGRRTLGLIARCILRIKGANWITVNSNSLEIWPLRSKATYIPNPVSATSKTSTITSSREVVFVGRLRTEKAPQIVIDACIESGAVVVLVGEGNLSQALRSVYASEQLVRFVGYLDNPWSSISSESLVVVASEYEGDGLVVLEAIQNGNPILLRDNGDLRRFSLDNRNYFTDQAQLARKISHFLKDPGQFKVTVEQRDALLKPRDISTVSKTWIDLIQNNLGR
jgi:glycosyltransferase involved in cell wall biosynthesis